MNLGEMIREFRIRHGDTVPPYFWGNAEVAGYFSDAEAEAAIRSRLIFDTEEFAVAANDPVIDLGDKLFDIQYAELRAVDGRCHEIVGTTRRELDRLRPGWRTAIVRPKEYIHDDKRLVLGSAVDAAYTLYLEFYRLPANPLLNDKDSPEIAVVHHGELKHWADHLALLKNDAETISPINAVDAEAGFTRIFGKRPSADLRRRQNANRPHRNKVVL